MIVQYLGFGFVAIIILCIFFTLLDFIFRKEKKIPKQNKKLLDNMKKLKK